MYICHIFIYFILLCIQTIFVINMSFRISKDLLSYSKVLTDVSELVIAIVIFAIYDFCYSSK